MSTIVGIGASQALEGFALTGVRVISAETEAEVTDAWAGLDDEVGLVILSPAAADTLDAALAARPHVLTVVMP